MPASKKHSELLVGLFLFIGLVLLGGLVLQFGKVRERFSGHYVITLIFDDASGVIKGSEVRMGGARIGQVASLPELNPAVKVEVPLSISSAIRIPVGSTFQINSATLLGDKLIAVIPADDRTRGFIEPNSRLSGAGPTGLDALQNNAEIVSREVLKILKQADATLAKVDSASQQLGEAVGKINRSLLADKNLAHFDSTMANLATASEQWKITSGKFEPTLNDARDALNAVEKAADRAEKTFKSADQTLAELKPAFAGLPKAVDDFANTARKAGKALDRMEKGQGLLGALSVDNDVALDAKAFMQNLRQHGILFYRNSASKTESRPPMKAPHR
jgi:ABC-type transporter Mla subunit MlaD